jgi:hypothetical protein
MGKTIRRLGEQADGKSKRKNDYHSLLKKNKNKSERRRAKLDPETQPAYGKYKGWET